MMSVDDVWLNNKKSVGAYAADLYSGLGGARTTVSVDDVGG